MGVVLMTLLPSMREFNIICFNKCQIRKQISALAEHEKFDFSKKLFLYRSDKGLLACHTKHGVHTKRSMILAIFCFNFRLHTRLDIYIFKCVLRSERVSL